MPTEEEKARGLSTHFAYDRPRLSVVLHYRLLAKNISSTYCDTFSQAKCIIIETDEPEDGRFCEQSWYACVHRHVGRCYSSRSSLRTSFFLFSENRHPFQLQGVFFTRLQVPCGLVLRIGRRWNFTSLSLTPQGIK